MFFLGEFSRWNRNLLNPGDIRSRNNYPRTVRKSPASNIDTIEEEEDDDAEERVTKLLVKTFSIHLFLSNSISFSSSKTGQTLTPIITQMIRSKSQ